MSEMTDPTAGEWHCSRCRVHRDAHNVESPDCVYDPEFIAATPDAGDASECDGCQKRPCVCETVVLPSAEGLSEGHECSPNRCCNGCGRHLTPHVLSFDSAMRPIPCAASTDASEDVSCGACNDAHPSDVSCSANDRPTETAAERAHRVVAESEARLCECDRLDQRSNPHRHERDEGCLAWAVLGETVLTLIRQRDDAYAQLDRETSAVTDGISDDEWSYVAAARAEERERIAQAIEAVRSPSLSVSENGLYDHAALPVLLAAAALTLVALVLDALCAPGEW